jgi:hypothetical protein
MVATPLQFAHRTIRTIQTRFPCPGRSTAQLSHCPNPDPTEVQILAQERGKGSSTYIHQQSLPYSTIRPLQGLVPGATDRNQRIWPKRVTTVGDSD